MSQANAAARKRRAGGASFEPANPTPQNTQQQLKPGAPAGLTLPQVIAVVDARLIALETFVKETKNASTQPKTVQTQAQAQAQVQISDETIDDLNDKFEILANEIADLKDIVLKLQSYTMEVNKTLMEERISILSDVNVTNDNKSQDGVTFNLTEITDNIASE
jgi:hypothetical protein